MRDEIVVYGMVGAAFIGVGAILADLSSSRRRAEAEADRLRGENATLRATVEMCRAGYMAPPATRPSERKPVGESDLAPPAPPVGEERIPAPVPPLPERPEGDR